mgnify:CR=1 FL=1
MNEQQDRKGQQGRGTAPKKEKKKNINTYLIIGDKEYKVEDVENMAKGGRAGFKSGMRVCKLAKRGKGKAYGKNS